MIKCPYCSYENEDGTLFCEQCKSDLNVMNQGEIPQAQPMEAEAALEAEAAKVAPPLVVGAPALSVETVDHAPVAQAIADTGAHAIPGPAVAEATAPALVPGNGATTLPAGAQPRLVVLRGLRLNVEYALFEGENYIGRTDEKPVDIDLEDQEPPDRIWSSRQHAVIVVDNGVITIEDLESSNGTFVNRTRLFPKTKRALQPGDVLQIGTVQMRLKI
jgi:hypothetical protein